MREPGSRLAAHRSPTGPTTSHGGPRGASFFWYTYLPARLKHPYVRGSPLERWSVARAAAVDPVAPFAEVAADGRYRGERGRGGFVRCDWEEASELTAAATSTRSASTGPTGWAVSRRSHPCRRSRSPPAVASCR